MEMIKNFSPRLYQQTILGTAARANTLVVLPTGMGKTAVAFMLAAQRLHHYPKSKILMLAPTKPLCEQHIESFRNHLNINQEKIVLFTGDVSPEKRGEMWEDAQVVVSTPQCVTGDTIIYTKNGPITIKDFVESFELSKKKYGNKIGFHANIEKNVLGFAKNSITYVNATNVWKLPAKKIIHIKTEMKHSLKCTPEHPLLTINDSGRIKWKKSEDLKEGDYIATPSKIEILSQKIDLYFEFQTSNLRLVDTELINILFRKLQEKGPVDKKYYNYKRRSMPLNTFFADAKKVKLDLPDFLLITNKTGKSTPLRLPHYLNEDLSYILGAMLADGHIGNRSSAHGNEVVYSELFYKTILNQFIKKVKLVFGIKPSTINSKKGAIYYSTVLALVLDKLGVPKGNKSKIIRVPKFIFNSKKSEISSFLSGVINADGDGHKNMFRVCSISKNFIFDLKWLFLTLGIDSLIAFNPSKKGKMRGGTINCSESFHLVISGQDNLQKMILFDELDENKKKNAKIKRVGIKKHGTRSKDILPVKEALRLAYQEHRKNGGKTIDQFRIAYSAGYLSKNYLKKNLPLLKSEKAKELLNILEKPLRWVKIKEIESIPYKGFVYDLTVEKEHNFITNFLVSHNTVENDIINDRVKLQNVSCLIIDEAHHATGEYAYVWIADRYEKTSKYARILGLTASPGSDLETVKQVCTNLKIEKVEVRTDKDHDMKPYIQDVKLNWMPVDFPEEYKLVQKYLKDCRKSKLLEAQGLGYCNDPDARKTDLLKLQGELIKKISMGEKDFDAMRAMSLVAEALKVEHGIELLECQGVHQCSEYLEGIQKQAITSKTKAVKHLMLDTNFKSALYHAQKLVENNVEHPKMIKLKEMLKDITEDKKAIIFTQFRDSANLIVKNLDEMNIKSHVFVGQAKKKGVGFNQKKQKEILDQFRNGEFQILVATSVAEEGLDIPKVDEVIFYEPVPSAIRAIQRRGRTGRLEKGEVSILMTAGTRDEGYKWSAHHKEKRMYRNLDTLKSDFTLVQEQQNKTLDQFIPKDQVVAIVADHREKNNRVVKELMELGVSVKTEQLISADYVVSGKVGVELKKVPDFVASIIDRRLLDQMRELKQNFEKSVLIIEGEEDIFSIRQVHANAIWGMLASIALGFNIPILYTKNPKDTASLLAVMAKREQDTGRSYSLHAGKPVSDIEQQEFFLSSIPNMGLVNARRLLEHFGSIKYVVGSSSEDFVKIDGIGKKTAERLVEFFEKEYIFKK